MFCKVIYYSDAAKGYTGRQYTYSSDLDLKAGDKVLCPIGASQEGKRAMITEVNVPESEVSDEWRDRIKSITSYDYVDVTEVL